MPDCYATVMPAWTTIPWEGSGSVTDPYIINYPSQLDLLAERVNSGTDPTDTKKYEDYTDTYFELGRDIVYAHTTDWDDAASTEKNFTSIGCYKHTTGIYYAERSFNGHFDGKGHRISGIRIFSRSNNDCIASYEGIFGMIGPSATVSGIILDDTRITGYNFIGGIAGQNNGTISDCLVFGSTVTIEGNNNVGDIVGDNSGTIQNCYDSSTALTITLGTNVTLGGTTTVYAVGGLTAYGNFALSDGTHIYSAAGNTITLAPQAGYTFTSASYNDGSNHEITPDNGVYSFQMPDKNVTVSASVVINTYTLALASEGNGTVTIPTPLPDGVTDNHNNTYTVNHGTEVTVKATPAEQHYLASWSNGTPKNPTLPYVKLPEYD